MAEETWHLVWFGEMDHGDWGCVVLGRDDDAYRGELIVKDKAGQEIHVQDVGIAYGAPFGADVDDIFEWQNITVDVVEHPEKRVPRG